jgi:hypothetical protein
MLEDSGSVRYVRRENELKQGRSPNVTHLAAWRAVALEAWAPYHDDSRQVLSHRATSQPYPGDLKSMME